jgi:hypothetical protein
MISEKTISKLIVKFLLSEILDVQAKLWDKSEKVLTKVLIKYLKAKTKILIKSKQERVDQVQSNDQKHRTKILLEVLSYKPKFLSRKK